MRFWTRRIFPAPDWEPRAFRARLFESWTETGFTPVGAIEEGFVHAKRRGCRHQRSMWAWQQLASCRGAVSSMFFGGGRAAVHALRANGWRKIHAAAARSSRSAATMPDSRRAVRNLGRPVSNRKADAGGGGDAPDIE